MGKPVPGRKPFYRKAESPGIRRAPPGKQKKRVAQTATGLFHEFFKVGSKVGASQ